MTHSVYDKFGLEYKEGRIKKHKTTKKQEGFLHRSKIKHHHIMCKKCGKKYCKCKDVVVK